MTSTDMTADDIYQKLHLSFPFLAIRKEDARDTPELTQLLLTLANHVDETGTSRSVAAELRSERARLAEQMRSWHESRLLHTLLEELAVRPAAAETAADDQLREAVAEGLSLAELADALPLSPPAADGAPSEDEPTLLGLTPDQLAPSAECRQTLARLPRALDRQLSRLGRRCAAAVCADDKDSEDVTGRLVRLPSELEELQQLRDTTSRQLADVLERRDTQILRQSQLMARQLEMLLNLINKHKLEHKVELERKTIDHLTSSIQGMLLKTRQLTLQIQVETYTEGCLAALRAAARHLRAESGRLDSQLNAAKHQLSANEAAGPQFAELARRYRELCQEVDHRRWLIAEMDTLGGAGEGAAGAGEGAAQR
ncbi:uncharacterized protein LOC122375499 [Amphibalanus amphitrite]|uniref:uncharacterized protein LOC122375499 n=1 Tax=Amphibalanus amphitrite TaxID=1232801 RepID=UPI001C91CEE3|nr:uncharacterized protein LOC122375499 [Amphibalanus amphitrite]XP_043210858.1 uncharacterized protein LOC122375499 [Amphibalanus amphitrite]XP_043210867.1 uncharacterized protein LOC122375499 [Amphibalanus amphitrite]XP_043210877.1 uncharacterized protein LOC122375499 [Amphibalanus amphitrite]